MKDEIRKCEKCGKEFITVNTTRRTLCYDCKPQRTRVCTRCGKSFWVRQKGSNRLRCYECSPEKSEEEKKKSKPKNPLALAELEAREHGMTYGQYQAYKMLHKE